MPALQLRIITLKLAIKLIQIFCTHKHNLNKAKTKTKNLYQQCIIIQSNNDW